MDFDPACLDFLEHFDRPKSADVDRNWVAGVERSEPPVPWDLIDAEPVRLAQTRGVGWVLQWAAALAVLVMAASILAQFGYLIAAENALNVAAQAGAMEATLPRATYQSVTATVHRRLEEHPHLYEHITLTLLQNGTPVIDSLRADEGDEFSIALSVPVSSAIPDWLEKTSLWHAQQYINAKATCRLPSRKLPPRTY
jgi:hypothetical protein